ncbi:MAG: MbnP family copper-binding protein [Cyanobacteria bacterium J06649_4]
MHKRLIGLALACSASFLSLTAALMKQQRAEAIASQTVTINFVGQAGGESFACGETYSLGTANTPVTATDFRFYVSQVALLDAEGNAVPLVLQQDGKWQHQDVALLDFEDKTGACANGTTETRTQVIGSVPAGDYTGLKFTLGVPFSLNHIDSTLAPSPLNLTSMWWNWNAGYKFARVDLMPVMDTAQTRQAHHHDGHSQAFAIHLGSVGCQMDAAEAPVACSIPNRPEVVLTDFDVNNNLVVADLAALLAQTNLTENAKDTPGGCMSSPADSDCAGIMQSLGLPFNDQPSTQQNFFTVE